MIEPGVRIIGSVVVGKDPSICAPAEIKAKDSSIIIGDTLVLAWTDAARPPRVRTAVARILP